MWKNYLLTSLRSLKKEKFYVLINLVSLAMAFALCTIGFFNYMYNNNYNQSFVGYDAIYKINAKQKSASSSKDVGISPVALKEGLLTLFPELSIGRFHGGSIRIRVQDQLFNESVGFVDPEFLEIISFDSADLKLNKEEIILTTEVALRLFGTSAVEGEILSVLFPNGKEHSLQVGAVIPVPNENTSFKFSVLIHMDQYLKTEEIVYNDWKSWVSGTFVKIEAVKLKSLELAIQEFLPAQNSLNPELEIASYRLDKIADWAHFEKELQGRSFGGVLHPASVIGTISSAFAILLLACFNFFNTTIATSGKRLKEISMRKVIGGQRKDIIIQFMTESGLQVIVAFLLSLLISKVLIDPYNAMFNFNLVEYQSAYLLPYILFSIGICLLTILLSGAYPAFYISKFSSLEILKNKTKFKGNSLITKSLLAIQFSICVYNLFSLGVFVENAFYQESLDRGYEVKKFINIPIQPTQFDQFKNELSQTSGFDVIKGTSQLVGFSNQEISIDHEGVEHTVGKLEVGAGYLSTLGVDFIEGNDFRTDRASNEHTAVVNQMFNTQMGSNMMGQWIAVGDKKYRVQGVTADFNLQNIMLTNKIKPTVFLYAPDSVFNYAVVKSEESKIVADQKRIEELWYQLFPDQLYGGFYQEKVFESEIKTNMIMVRINVFIAIVSILISILGLYALISLTVQRRIKEIGIRKTLGASFGHISKLLLREVGWMMMVSLVLGLIAGTYFINMLLNIIYAYHIKIDVLNYTFPVVAIIISAAISIGYKVVATSRMNPVSQLRAD